MPKPRPTTQEALNKCQLVLLLLFSAYCVPGTYRAAVRNTGRDWETRRGQEQRVCRDREEAERRGRGDPGQGRLWGNGQGPQGPREPSPVVRREGERSALLLMGAQRLVQPLMRTLVEPTFDLLLKFDLCARKNEMKRTPLPQTSLRWPLGCLRTSAAHPHLSSSTTLPKPLALTVWGLEGGV